MAKTDPKTINKKLQSALIEARKTAGLTQSDIAEVLKKPQSFVSKYETGERKLTTGDFVIVCDALGVKASKLLEAVQ